MIEPVCKSDSGTAAIEFALVLPVLLLFTLGLIDVGRLLWTQTTLDRAVQAAARCAAVNSATCGTTAHVQSYAVTQAYGLSINSSAFTVTSGTGNICVNATMVYHLIIPWVDDTLNLSANACYPVS